jgi:hypothetical protein
MFKTLKKLFSDKRGEDLAEVSSGLSKGAKVVITLGVVTATAAGAATLSNTSNNATDTAAEKVVAPVGAQAGKTQQSGPVYK